MSGRTVHSRPGLVIDDLGLQCLAGCDDEYTFAIPASSPAPKLPRSDVFVFPATVSVGMKRETVSKVTNRTPDLDALEAQKAKLPVYNRERPCCLIVLINNRRGDWRTVVPFSWNSCWRVLRYSVGY